MQVNFFLIGLQSRSWKGRESNIELYNKYFSGGISCSPAQGIQIFLICPRYAIYEWNKTCMRIGAVMLNMCTAHKFVKTVEFTIIRDYYVFAYVEVILVMSKTSLSCWFQGFTHKGVLVNRKKTNSFVRIYFM